MAARQGGFEFGPCSLRELRVLVGTPYGERTGTVTFEDPKKRVNRGYDLSLVRADGEIPMDKILGLDVGRRALLRQAEGNSREDYGAVRKYTDVVRAQLGTNSGDYAFRVSEIDGKASLTVMRRNT